MKKLLVMILIPLAAGITGCGRKTTEPVAESQSVKESVVTAAPGGAARALPKATAFKMNGDYGNFVGVTVDANGKLTYFPAPTDISALSAPVSLGNGWWLNRQGLGAGSVFTRWTFEQYSKLKKVPSPEEILKNVIPGSKVESFTVLPYPMTGILNRLEEVKQFLKGPEPPSPAK